MSDALTRLQANLKQELELVRQFMLALQAEASALTAPNDNDALNASTAQKNQFAEKLAHTEQTRRALLQELGYGDDKTGLDAAATASPALQPTYHALCDLTRQASELNTANGIIINTYLEHNQRAIDTLRRLVGIGDLYDANGRTRAVSANNKKNIKAG